MRARLVVRAGPCLRGLGDRGGVLAEFVAVAALCTLVLAALLQLAFALHVRTVLVDATADGAREGALADRGPEDGAARARELIAQRLAPRYARDVSASTRVLDGLPVVEVAATAPLPVVALAGTATTVTVRGHALLPPAAP